MGKKNSKLKQDTIDRLTTDTYCKYGRGKRELLHNENISLVRVRRNPFTRIGNSSNTIAPPHPQQSIVTNEILLFSIEDYFQYSSVLDLCQICYRSARIVLATQLLETNMKHRKKKANFLLILNSKEETFPTYLERKKGKSVINYINNLFVPRTAIVVVCPQYPFWFTIIMLPSMLSILTYTKRIIHSFVCAGESIAMHDECWMDNKCFLFSSRSRPRNSHRKGDSTMAQRIPERLSQRTTHRTSNWRSNWLN